MGGLWGYATDANKNALWCKRHRQVSRDTVTDRGAQVVIPLRRNARPCRPSFRASNCLGRAIWRKWSGYHRQSRAKTQAHCMKLLGQQYMARDLDRKVVELQVRAAMLKGYTALGIPVTKPMGCVRSGKGEVQCFTPFAQQSLKNHSPTTRTIIPSNPSTISTWHPKREFGLRFSEKSSISSSSPSGAPTFSI